MGTKPEFTSAYSLHRSGGRSDVKGKPETHHQTRQIPLSGAYAQCGVPGQDARKEQRPAQEKPSVAAISVVAYSRVEKTMGGILRTAFGQCAANCEIPGTIHPPGSDQ